MIWSFFILFSGKYRMTIFFMDFTLIERFIYFSIIFAVSSFSVVLRLFEYLMDFVFARFGGFYGFCHFFFINMDNNLCILRY